MHFCCTRAILYLHIDHFKKQNKTKYALRRKTKKKEENKMRILLHFVPYGYYHRKEINQTVKLLKKSISLSFSLCACLRAFHLNRWNRKKTKNFKKSDVDTILVQNNWVVGIQYCTERIMKITIIMVYRQYRIG